MKRVNYLNNRDLLKQIHKSKNTFCSYVAPEDSNYDIIVKDLKKINRNTIAQARKLRAKRLTQEAWETAKAQAGYVSADSLNPAITRTTAVLSVLILGGLKSASVSSSGSLLSSVSKGEPTSEALSELAGSSTDVRTASAWITTGFSSG